MTAPTPGFSDEDLKQWEKELDAYEKFDPNALMLGAHFVPGMRALLRRLRAAEKLVECYEYGRGDGKNYSTLLSAWRRSKGDIS